MPNAPARILLVEDNKVNQLVAIAMLSTRGYEIEIAENGVQAVEAVAKSRFDVILMDIQMPKMNGVDATKEIRQLASDRCSIPIIAVTANAMRGDRETYLAAGMDDYISKPINSKQLIEKIEYWRQARGGDPTQATTEEA